MAQEVRLWEIVEGDSLQAIKKSKLNLEERIENWLEKDISIISDDLLVIGRQVNTDFGGTIDILCLDADGDVVIVELKKDKTPREITAQVLDYATWVKDLSNENIGDIASNYFKGRLTLEEAYRNSFKEDCPEVINESHKMLVVASEIDSSSERIIKYLSESHGIGINSVTFNYFKTENEKEYLSRVFLIEPSDVDYNTRTKGRTKKARSLTLEEFQEVADNNGIGSIYSKAYTDLRPLFNTATRHITGIALKGVMGEQKTLCSIIVLYPVGSSSEKGLLFTIYVDRATDYFSCTKEAIIGVLPSISKKLDWSEGDIYEMYFKEGSEIDRLVAVLTSIKGIS